MGGVHYLHSFYVFAASFVVWFDVSACPLSITVAVLHGHAIIIAVLFVVGWLLDKIAAPVIVEWLKQKVIPPKKAKPKHPASRLRE